MINVIASIKIKSSQIESFIQIFKSNIPNVLNEEGCIEYSATIDFKTDLPIQALDSTMVTIIEKWESFNHLKAHFTAPHMLQYKSEVEEMVYSVSLKVLENV